MAQPYVGEIRMFAGTFNPNGWQFCNGQLLPIAENETLFQLIGTTYGGDGQSTFALPDLQSRVPIHQGAGKFGTTYQLAEQGGAEEVTLTTAQIPTHTHAVMASLGPANQSNPVGSITGTSSSIQIYIEDSVDSAFGNIVQPVGGSQPHTNLQPYLCVNFIISLFGLFPSQN